MQHSDDEKGTAQVMLKRLADQRLPRLLEMQGRVEKGELLSDNDISFLEGAFEDAKHNRQHVVKFPEYDELVGKVAQLYQEITSKALENQNAQKK